jgi:hypothetical protein
VLAPPVAPIDELVPGSGIDLEAVRAAMPDNLYWEFAAPTQDQRLLAERDRERARWNETFGRVQAGDASKEEIEASSIIASARATRPGHHHMLEHYHSTLSDIRRCCTLRGVASRARFRAAPGSVCRGKTQEARAAWRAQQQEFQPEETPDAPPVP